MSQTNLQLSSVIDDGLLLDAKLGTDDLVALYVQSKTEQINEEIRKLTDSFPKLDMNFQKELQENEWKFVIKMISAIKRKFSKDKCISIDKESVSTDTIEYHYDYKARKLFINNITFEIDIPEDLFAEAKKREDVNSETARIQNKMYALNTQKGNTQAMMNEGRAIIAQYKLQKAGHTELLKKIEATT